ncbi:hypothetical protein DFH09DRAFT_1071292 [Mycena vulgaris]|nr:hypothetical protein DFH09DRAFT_1071292 [Mycena vulgaris]
MITHIKLQRRSGREGEGERCCVGVRWDAPDRTLERREDGSCSARECRGSVHANSNVETLPSIPKDLENGDVVCAGRSLNAVEARSKITAGRIAYVTATKDECQMNAQKNCNAPSRTGDLTAPTNSALPLFCRVPAADTPASDLG